MSTMRNALLALDDSWALPFVVAYCILVSLSAYALNEFDQRYFPKQAIPAITLWIQLVLLPLFYTMQCLATALGIRILLRLTTRATLSFRNVILSLSFAHLPLILWAAGCVVFLSVSIPRLEMGTPAGPDIPKEYYRLVAATQVARVPFFVLATCYFVWDLWFREQRRLPLRALAGSCALGWLLALVVGRLW
jgi:hypothetical protein